MFQYIMGPPGSPLTPRDCVGRMGFISTMGGSYKEPAFSSMSQEGICRDWSSSIKD